MSYFSEKSSFITKLHYSCPWFPEQKSLFFFMKLQLRKKSSYRKGLFYASQYVFAEKCSLNNTTHIPLNLFNQSCNEELKFTI